MTGRVVMHSTETDRRHFGGEIWRSLLFSPGQRQNMIDKALGLDADGVILDLEDGVPPAAKDVARAQAAAAITSRPPRGPAVLVRINPAATGRMTADVTAVTQPGLDAILLPKVEAAGEVRALEGLLDECERQAGVAPGTVAIVAAIESARGVHEAVEISLASARIAGLMFGAEDFALDLGLPVVRRGAGDELLFARSAIVVAASIGRVQAFDQVWLDFRDEAGLRASAASGRDLGFSGKCLIHPAQIGIVNEVFAPSEEDADQAREIVRAFESARSQGLGAIMLGGQLVELPIVERAQRSLRAYAAAKAMRGASTDAD